MFSEVRYPEIMHSTLKNKFCMIFHVEGLCTATKHFQTSVWVQQVRLEAFVAKCFPEVQYPRYCITHQSTSFACFFMWKVCVMLWNTSKHHFGSNRLDWRVRGKMFSGSWVPWDSAFRTETQVLHDFIEWKAFVLIWNTSKHQQVRLDAFLAKCFLEVQYPKILHYAPKHMFCMIFCVESLCNALKHFQTSFWI